MLIHHRLLRRMQLATGLLEVLNRKQNLILNRVGKPNAAIDGMQAWPAIFHSAHHHRAGATIALGAAFLGALQIKVFSNQLQQSLIRRNIVQDDLLMIFKKS